LREAPSLNPIAGRFTRSGNRWQTPANAGEAQNPKLIDIDN